MQSHAGILGGGHVTALSHGWHGSHILGGHVLELDVTKP